MKKETIRDKNRDEKIFDYTDFRNINYISRLYSENKEKVKIFLNENIKDNILLGLSYMEIYKLVKEELNLKIPS